MRKKLNNNHGTLRPFLTLWSTQAFSALGSSMTGFALILWSYQQHGSALTTALLSVCSYAPYVLLSIFAGIISDRWDKKRTMLVCDTLAALTTFIVWILFWTGSLQVWHLYVINALNGMMNSIQQPASEVAVSLLAPKEAYQKVGGLRSFSNSLVTILTPVIATAVFAFVGLDAVILFDLASFAVAFCSLAFGITIPKPVQGGDEIRETVMESAKAGLHYLCGNRGILHLILFLAAINLIASVYEAALPPMLLSKAGENALAIVSAFTGIANVIGSVIASLLPAPKKRGRVICNCLLFSMCTENFFLAFGKGIPIWCLGAVLGWLLIPLMNTNMDVLLRSQIPIDMQGRVYSIRNALQFFTIPLGYLLGGFLVDRVFEPFMRGRTGILTGLFGSGKGSGAAMLYSVLAVAGILVCMYFRRDKRIHELEDHT